MTPVLRVSLVLILSYVAGQVLLRKMSLIEAFAFLLPFKRFNFELGLMLWLFYVPIIVILIGYILYPHKIRQVRFNKYFILWVGYIIISTIIVSNFFIDEWNENVFGTFFREKGRYITSIIKLCFFQAGIFAIVYSEVRTNEALKRCLKRYLQAICLLAILGLIQWIVYFLTGTDLFPYTTKNALPHSAIAEFISEGIGSIRVTSLGGEPKGIAASLVVAISLIAINRKAKYFSISHELKAIVLYTLVLILTLSTGGYGLFAIFIVTHFLLNLFTGKIKLSINSKQAIGFILVTTILLVARKPVKNILETRIYQRSSEFLSEDIDQAIQDFLIADSKWILFGVGAGNIHNFAYEYIDSRYDREVMKGQIFVSRYGIIRQISENGILGLLLFMIFVLSVLKNFLFQAHVSGHHFFLFTSIMVVLFYFARSGYVESEMFFILGLAASYKGMRKNLFA